MLEDWKTPIGAAFKVREQVAQIDLEHIWPFHPPEVPADEATIALAEQQLGFRLDPQYRAFLLCANGWQAFYQGVDLFGTEDLVGSSRMKRALELRDTLSPTVDRTRLNLGLG